MKYINRKFSITTLTGKINFINPFSNNADCLKDIEYCRR